MTRLISGPDEATRRRQKRETLLASLCCKVVDWYRSPDGVITQEMAVAAKVAIMDQLGALAIEELSQSELSLRGEAIRNAIFSPYLRRQQAQAKHQKKRQHHDALRSQQETGGRVRQMIRKTALLELGVTRALKLAGARDFPARALVLLEWEIRARLDAWLVGDETAQHVEEVIEAAIQRPVLDWEIRMERFESAKRERILDQCLTLALPVAEAAWPWVKDVVLTKAWEAFGLKPTPPHASPRTKGSASSNAESTSSSEQSGATSEAPTSHSVRPQRVRRTGPIGEPGETVRPSEPIVSKSPGRDEV